MSTLSDIFLVLSGPQVIDIGRYYLLAYVNNILYSVVVLAYHKNINYSACYRIKLVYHSLKYLYYYQNIPLNFLLIVQEVYSYLVFHSLFYQLDGYLKRENA